MNHKFFDLSKEKQDRMINAALSVFAQGEFRHASTDEIIKRAGISKGLLFHYFISKQGLYNFLYDYSVKYTTLEVNSFVSVKENDYFELRKQFESANLNIRKVYPFMQQFLRKAGEESDIKVRSAVADKEEQWKQLYIDIMRRVDFSNFSIEPEKAIHIMDYTIEGLIIDCMRQECFSPEALYEQIADYLELFRKMMVDEPVASVV